MDRRLNQAHIIGVILIIFGAVALIASFQIKPELDGGWGARIFPLLGSGAIFLLGTLEFLKAWRGDAPVSVGNTKLSRVMSLLALALAYVWLMGKLGYLISTGIAAPLALMLFGIRNPLGLIAAAIICPAVYHSTFFIGLGLFPPFGEWFDLLDLIRRTE